MKERFPRRFEHNSSDLAVVSAPVLAPDPGMETDGETMGLVQEYALTLRRYKWSIAMFAIVGVLVSQVFHLRSPPLYRTRTSLDIRNLNTDFMDMRTVAQTGDDSGGAADTNLQTQIKLLQSDSLLQGTLARMRAEPHSEAVQRQDLLSRLRRLAHLGGTAPIPYDLALEDASQRLKVKPLGVTRLVEITCDAWSPQLAAQFCNDLAATFQENDLQTRSSEAAKTSEWLTKQVSDIRDRAQETQAKVEAAVGNNGLVLSPNNTVGQDRLRALQDELVKAQSDRIAKEAEWGIGRKAAAGTAPVVQDNPTRRAYEAQVADLRAQLARLAPALTEEAPKIKTLRSQMEAAEAGMQEADQTSLARENNELSSARHREVLLNVTYSAELSKVSADLQRAAKVSLLRSELDSEQQLYQTLLQRAKEAGFASAMRAATIRVVDPAKAPLFAFSPQRKIAGGVGLFLGAVAGMLCAFYRERTLNVFRKPGDVQRYLHVQELGTIPAHRMSRGKQLSSEKPKGAPDSLGPLRDRIETTTLAHWGDEFSLVAEAYRNTTLSIMISEAKKGPRAYVVASPNAAEGKTSITSNLGVALSKSKVRVVLVDGDLRKPNLHHAFVVENRVGLRNILRGEFDLSTAPLQAFTQRTALPNVTVITAGQGSEELMELLHSPVLPRLLQRLSLDFDMVLIDTPPTLHMADTRILARHADGVILVFRAAKTTLEAAAMARDLFDRDGTPLIGTILNDFNPEREGWKNYYKDYYRYQRKGISNKEASAA